MNKELPFLSHIQNAVIKAWTSPSGMMMDTHKYQNKLGQDCWRILIFPAIREIMGGQQDGEKLYARFIVDINKLQRIFDKCPRTLFDTSQGEFVPHILLIGKINGIKCNILVMSSPFGTDFATERFYAEGPKKGKLEIVLPEKTKEQQ